MSTTFSTCATNVMTRLNVGSGGGEPTSAHIQQFLRDAARELWGQLPPVVERSYTVATGFTVTLPETLRVLFVVYGGLTLLRGSEWNKHESSLTFTPGSVGIGDTVTVYLVPNLDLADSATEVESSCLFGPDWLQPLLMKRAEMEVHNRISNVATSERSDANAALYRVKQADYAAMQAGHQQVWNAWYQEMMGSVQARLQAGDRPYVEHPAAGYTNKSRRRTAWTG